MQSYTPQEQAFLLYHNLLSALFPAALADKAVAKLLRERIYYEMPHNIALYLLDTLEYIQEFQDDFQHQDQQAS